MKSVLVSTIPSWSQHSGANTFASLLEDVEGIEVANIYFKAELPDSSVAKRYFHVVENKVIKNLIHPSVLTGEEVGNNNDDTENIESSVERKRYAFFSRNRNYLFLWGREFLWKIGRWKSAELDKFLDEVNPDVFMFSIESYLYFNRINEYIIRRCNPKKIIVYWWDDNFTYKQSSSWSYYLFRFFIRRNAKRLMRQATDVLAISPKMKKECDSFFNVNSTLIAKPVRTEQKPIYIRDEVKPVRFIYTGSMVIGRHKSLISLAKVIERINKNGQRAMLDIYSRTQLNKHDMDALNIPGSCEIKGSIPQSQVFEEQLKSDVLVFVESFENKTARLSFSTKLTDYLSSGRCILAIGPDDISSMEYLSSEDAAITCFNETDLYNKVGQIINTPDIIDTYAEKSWACGVRNHNRETNNQIIKKILFK